MSSITVEVVYRGIFQKNLGQRIGRGIVLAARKEGKVGISFGRYGDSPERNGIPAKQFAIVADDELELQISMARYEPTVVDITIAVDDTLCKGVESWAWYGTQPINKLLHENGLLLVTSIHSPDTLLQWIHRQPYEYDMAIVKGPASFSGLWVYKEDHTEVRVLGTLARVAPQLFGMKALEQAIMQEWNDSLKVTSAQKAFDRAVPRRVTTAEGNTAPVEEFEKPKYWEMQDAIVVKGIAVGKGFRGEEGGLPAGTQSSTSRSTPRGRCGRWSISINASSVPCAGCNAPIPVSTSHPNICMMLTWRLAAAVGCAKRCARWLTASPW